MAELVISFAKRSVISDAVAADPVNMVNVIAAARQTEYQA